jgi:hypothetical protein
MSTLPSPTPQVPTWLVALLAALLTAALVYAGWMLRSWLEVCRCLA